MPQILIFILIIAIILFAALLIFKYRLKNESSLQKANQAIENKKESAKDKILSLFEKKDKINNTDVENLLSVSDATATNYLDELEKEGKILQQGKTGKWVFYTKING